MIAMELWPRRRRAGRFASACWRPGMLALGALVLAACGGPRPPTAPAEPSVIFRDDFSDINSGWDQHRGADVVTDYDEGGYLLAVEEPGVSVWARPGLDLADVVLEADAQHAAGPDNNEYGLMCRYSRGGDGRNSFYFFMVSSDGYYALGKVVRDVRTILSPAEGSFQPIEAVAFDPRAVNRLRASCQGTQLALSLNGELLAEFSDSELARGDVGVLAGSFDEGGVRITFDNVVVQQPG